MLFRSGSLFDVGGAQRRRELRAGPQVHPQTLSSTPGPGAAAKRGKRSNCKQTAKVILYLRKKYDFCCFCLCVLPIGVCVWVKHLRLSPKFLQKFKNHCKAFVKWLQWVLQSNEMRHSPAKGRKNRRIFAVFMHT